jgi:transcriptional regulator with XRE-family HTH domain
MEPERTAGNFNRVVVQTEQEPQTAGELIRFWRTRRGLSQLELSLDANVSTKHLSFVETGRSSPSRQLLVHLAQHLDLPIAERNRLLLAGGFAPPYLELPYDGEVMQPLRESLERLLEAHEPNPALIVDGLWTPSRPRRRGEYGHPASAVPAGSASCDHAEPSEGSGCLFPSPLTPVVQQDPNSQRVLTASRFERRADAAVRELRCVRRVPGAGPLAGRAALGKRRTSY